MTKKKIRRRLWPLVALGIMSLGGVVMKLALKKVWKGVRHRRPPEKPDQKVTSWRDMILWTVLSGLISAFSKLLLAQTSRWAGERFDAV